MLDDYEMADLRRLRLSRPASGDTLDYRMTPTKKNPGRWPTAAAAFGAGWH
jgi:hypothetical protein